MRRAPAQADTLRAGNASAAQWCAVFATAVAEENAAAAASSPRRPTVRRARRRTALPFPGDATIHREQGTVDFLLTARAIGGLLPDGGMVQAGCQSEVGVAAAMAAAGYAARRAAPTTKC